MLKQRKHRKYTKNLSCIQINNTIKNKKTFTKSRIVRILPNIVTTVYFFMGGMCRRRCGMTSLSLVLGVLEGIYSYKKQLPGLATPSPTPPVFLSGWYRKVAYFGYLSFIFFYGTSSKSVCSNNWNKLDCYIFLIYFCKILTYEEKHWKNKYTVSLVRILKVLPKHFLKRNISNGVC